jgi:putative hydrolase of the HAD superfamily
VVVPDLTAVLFDLGGTLDAAGVPWKERVFRLYRSEGVAVDPEEFDRIFYRADDAIVGAIPAAVSFRETVQRLVDGVSAGLKIDDERLSARVAAQFVDRATTSARANARVLADLAGRYRLGIVSNFYGNLATVCEDLGLRSHLAVMVDSTDLGWTKPDPRLFRHALDALGVEASRAAFVGDSLPRDMAGARRTGMPHIWLAGDVAPLPSGCCPGDRVIAEIEDLRGLLL